ncbi:MAG: enoyl-CoA hydratase/isomerase family protein [Coriobacteriales bacterium]|jgi:crotonobetainyl-CoA hydratase|nr:enoyl-CoA hydratase/isomerase family protein [Coriobacteriales bacterium]
MSDVVLTEKKGKAFIITINRPENGNAIIPEVTEGIEVAFNRAEADSDVAAVVITGAGEKIFCGGMDLKFLMTHSLEEVAKVSTANGFAALTQRVSTKPVICAVNGAALGGGTEIALNCDLVVAAEHARFGLPEVKRGIMAGAGGPIRLARQVPRAVGMEMVLTGAAYSAQQAKEMFLVNRVVPSAELMEKTLELVEEIANNAPLSIAASKELFLYSLTHSEDEAFTLSNKLGARVGASEDAKEGPRAFAEKRKPVWQGK